MKQKIKQLLSLIKQTLYDDVLDRYLLLASLLLFLVDFFIWRAAISGGMPFIFLRINIYPIKYLAIVMFLNTSLSVAAHDSEKEVGYLLLMGNIIVGLLCLILEIFYLTQMS